MVILSDSSEHNPMVILSDSSAGTRREAVS